MFTRLAFLAPWIALPLFLVTLLPMGAEARTLTLTERLSGRILLQVERRGEAWYVDPVSKQRFYLGTAADAFALLRSKGLGIRHADFVRFREASRFPARLSGRILIDVDERGQAYYILPTTMRPLRLGNAEETYQVLRQAGLGIRNRDLDMIRAAPFTLPAPITPAPTPSLPPTSLTPTAPLSPTPAPYSEIEQQTQISINQHRQSIGLAPLIWNDVVAEAARAHSENMARERISFGHDGFDERFDQINARLPISRMGENVAANTYLNTVDIAIQGWLDSSGHRSNIENSAYTHTGIGVAKSDLGEYFLTQLFITPRSH